MEKSKVYFIKEVSPENVVHAYEALGVELKGNVAVKLHSGEPGNQNFLRPDFMKPAVDRVGGTIVECNTAYDGQRDTTDAHRRPCSCTAGSRSLMLTSWMPRAK